MALKPDTNFVNFTAASANYPLGASKDDSTGTTGDGTEHTATRANDLFGMMQALLRLGGLTPTATADTALASQYVHGMIQLAQGRAELYDDGGAVNAYLATPRTNQQTPNGVFEGQRFKVKITTTNTGASTLDISKIVNQNASFGTTIVNVRLPGGTVAVAAGDIVSGREVEFAYRTTPSIHAELIKLSGMSAVQSFTTTGTYTPTPGARYVLVFLQAPGGGSGGCAATAGGQYSAASGGAGGGWDIGLFSLAGVASVAVTIGAAGTGGAAGNNDGTAGGTVSFGAFMSATGGGLGQGSPTAVGADDFRNLPSAGGVGTGGLFLGKGGSGLEAWISVSNGNSNGGQGGGSFMSGDNISNAVGSGTAAGIAGAGYGQGASGAANGPSQTAKAGAAGGPGIIVVMEIF